MDALSAVARAIFVTWILKYLQGLSRSHAFRAVRVEVSSQHLRRHQWYVRLSRTTTSKVSVRPRIVAGVRQRRCRLDHHNLESRNIDSIDQKLMRLRIA